MREGRKSLDGLEWGKGGDSGVDVEADVSAGSRLGDLIEGAINLILQSRDRLEALLTSIWVDTIKLSLLTTN